MDNTILLKTIVLGIVLEIILFPIFFLFIVQDEIISSCLIPLCIINPICWIFFFYSHSKLEEVEEKELELLIN